VTNSPWFSDVLYDGKAFLAKKALKACKKVDRMEAGNEINSPKVWEHRRLWRFPWQPAKPKDKGNSSMGRDKRAKQHHNKEDNFPAADDHNLHKRIPNSKQILTAIRSKKRTSSLRA